MRLSPHWLGGIRCRFQPTFDINTLTGKCCPRQRALITDSLTLLPRSASLPHAVCVCPIGQLFRTNRNTRLDTRASSQLALRRLNFPRLELISCAVCGKVAAWLMTVAMRFQLVSNGHNATEQEWGIEKERQREWKGTRIVLRLFSICQCTNQNCHTFFTVYFPFSTQFINFNSKTYSSWSAMINMICLSSLINGSCGLGDRKH